MNQVGISHSFHCLDYSGFGNKDQFNYLDYVHNLKAYGQKSELDIKRKDNFLEIGLNSDQLFLKYKVDKQPYFPEPFVTDHLYH